MTRNTVEEHIRGAAIFTRAFLIYRPLGRFGTPGYDKNSRPPGDVAC